MPDAVKPSLPSKLRELVASLRELVLVGLLLVLVIEPSQIKRIAEAAGIKSAFDVEFRDALEEQAETIVQAQTAVREVTQAVDDLEKGTREGGRLSARDLEQVRESARKTRDAMNEAARTHEELRRIERRGG